MVGPALPSTGVLRATLAERNPGLCFIDGAFAPTLAPSFRPLASPELTSSLCHVIPGGLWDGTAAFRCRHGAADIGARITSVCDKGSTREEPPMLLEVFVEKDERESPVGTSFRG